jgi:hypothetical protein
MVRGTVWVGLCSAVGAFLLLPLMFALAMTPASQSASSQSTPIIVASFLPAPGSRWAEDFQKYVVPHIPAVMVRVDWNKIESTHGVYDFAPLDEKITPWTKQGKKVAIIVELVNDAVVGRGPNTSTPDYVFTAAWAEKCCKSKQLDTATCPFNSNPIPVAYEKPFVAAAEPFLAAVLQHLAANPAILYVRSGFAEGGENSPVCHRKWPGWSDRKWLDYFAEMSNYIGGLHSPVRFVNNASGLLGPEVADAEADLLHAAGLGIGMQSLRDTDKTNYEQGKPCSDDWCAWTTKYSNDFRYLQPAGNQATPLGLTVYVPFARKLGINALEIFNRDLLTAYDPNYPGYAEYGAAYRAALALP